jgi:hypothetical protein
MRIMNYFIFTLSFCFFLQACSSAKVRVMPGETDVNKVVATDYEKDDAEEAANDAAQEYCKKRGKEAAFVKDESKYKGSMDENTRKTVRKASKAAMVLGGAGVGAGTAVGAGTTAPGAILGSAGTVGTIMTNDRDYEATVLFKCK